MQKALVAGIATAVVCSFMGTFLVLRRYSLFGDGISHVALSTPTTDIHKKLLTHLYAYRKARVTRMLEEFEHKVKEGKTARKNSVIKKALAVGAVGTLYVSAQYRSNPKHLEIMRMLEMAENTSAGIEFVSAPNLVKKLDINDSVLAVLRYKIK